MKNENGIEKSAILKGQTLVNLLTYFMPNAVYLDTQYRIMFSNVDSFDKITIVNKNSKTIQFSYWITNWVNYEIPAFNNVLIELPKEVNEYNIYALDTFGWDSTNYREALDNLVLLHGDYVNQDIPYFEGMQSVKLPVLTTTGKNLILRQIFNDDNSLNTYTGVNDITSVVIEGNRMICQGNIDNQLRFRFKGLRLEEGKTYVFSYSNAYMIDTSTGQTEQTYVGMGTSSILKPTSTIFGEIAFSKPSSIQKSKYVQLIIEDFQLEEGTVATTYEPYKSNILSTPSDLELRGIGDVQDELDLIRGEVTERIGEIVIDGTEDWIRFTVKNGISLFHLYTNNYSISNYEFNCVTPLKTVKYANYYPNVWEDSTVSLFNGYHQQGREGIGIFSNKQSVNEFKSWLSQNPLKMVIILKNPTVKTVDLTITDQDNQPQERMKLFPNGHINTSSSTFPPILELKGITHNNKLNMTTTNGTNNTQLATLDNLVLDGIICRDGTVVRDSYDVESGLYTKRVFRFTIDEDFIERYRDKISGATSTTSFEMNLHIVNYCNYPIANSIRGIASNIQWNPTGEINRVILNRDRLYIRLLKEEVSSYDVDGILEWIKRNGTIEVAYQMATPQIIHMQPNMTPYVSTRPYQGSIESQGNILESSYLDYTSEQSIISPKPLGDGDILRWEQGSQCYVYENDKEYIPLTNYNQPMGTVLDLEEEDGEQFVENLDGGDIIVDVPFKEKAVYERHLIPHEDNVIYPTQDKLDPTGKIEVDYICGKTWQNPNDLSDIRHVGTLREDGQYDVTIRRSGDDEIRLMDGTTHLSLDGEGLNPSEFELTFFNSGGVEVGKYGDTIHTLEDCVLDSKLETGMVYGADILVNLATWGEEDENFIDAGNTDGNTYSRWMRAGINKGTITNRSLYGVKYNPVADNGVCSLIYRMYEMPNYKYGQEYTAFATVVNSTPWDLNIYASSTGYNGQDGGVKLGAVKANSTSRICNKFTTHESIKYRIGNSLYTPTSTSQTVEFKDLVILEGDYTNYPTLIPFFEGVGSTIVNGFTTVGKNLWTSENYGSHYGVGHTYVLKGYKPTYPVTLSSKAQRTISKGIHVKPNTYYTISITNCDLDISKYFLMATWYRKEEDAINDSVTTPQCVINTHSGRGTTTTFKTPLDCYYMVCGFAINYTYEQQGGEIVLYEEPMIQVEEGQTVTEFEEPKSIKYTLPTPITLNKVGNVVDTYDVVSGVETRRINPTTLEVLTSPQTIQHTLIPSTVETMQEPTFILPQPLRSVPNGICDRLYWDENKGHYCIEKRVGDVTTDFEKSGVVSDYGDRWEYQLHFSMYQQPRMVSITNSMFFNVASDVVGFGGQYGSYMWINYPKTKFPTQQDVLDYIRTSPITMWYTLETSEIIDLPHLNKKLILPTQPDTLPIGYKVEYPKANPQLGLTIPYKQLNYPSRPQNIDFKMDIADYVLTWDDVKEARQYNVILNDRVIATVKEPQWNSGEEMYGYIMVEAQNELAENLSEELYIKTVPNAPAQLTVAHNPMTDYYDFEISFIKTSAIAEYYTVQYRIDGGEWVYKTIQSDEIDPNSKVLWRFSIYEINEQIEVWATATNEIGTNDILPIATYYMSPTPQWTYRINSKELFVRWMDDSPYDTQYKLRYQYKSDGIFRYAYFEGDKQEIGKLYEALIPLADDEEVSIALCIISEKENLYTKPIRASKELDPNIKPPKNFNYHWLARGLIEFYWEDNYDVDVEYEAIVEHRLTSGNNEWITDTRIFSATDTEGTGAVYRLSYQMEDLEEIRVKVRMKWAMNETEWSESLTTVFIPVEGNPPQWIRRTQTQEGLLVEWEAQEYVDSYHVYVMSNGEELQHLETMDNFIYVDLDYSNPIDIEIYEATRFSGGIQSDPTDKMCFRPTMDKHQLIHDVVTPDTLTYEIEVDTIQKGIKERQVIHDINTTPKVTSKQPMDVAISSPFTLSFHPLQLDVHQSGSKYYGDTELHIKTLDVKSRDAIEVLTFERITDQYGVDFTVYTPSASKYPITLEVNRVRIVCFGDSLTSGGKYYQIGNMDNRLVG